MGHVADVLYSLEWLCAFSKTHFGVTAMTIAGRSVFSWPWNCLYLSVWYFTPRRPLSCPSLNRADDRGLPRYNTTRTYTHRSVGHKSVFYYNRHALTGAHYSLLSNKLFMFFLELQDKANAVVLFQIMMWPFPTIFFVLFAFTIILLQIVWIKTPMSSASGCRFVFTLWHTAPFGQQCDFPKSQFSVCRAIFVMRHCDWRSWYRTMRPWIGLVVIY